MCVYVGGFLGLIHCVESESAVVLEKVPTVSCKTSAVTSSRCVMCKRVVNSASSSELRTVLASADCGGQWGNHASTECAVLGNTSNSAAIRFFAYRYLVFESLRVAGGCAMHKSMFSIKLLVWYWYSLDL